MEYNLFGVIWDSYFQVNRVEYQKVNQTTHYIRRRLVEFLVFNSTFGKCSGLKYPIISPLHSFPRWADHHLPRSPDFAQASEISPFRFWQKRRIKSQRNTRGTLSAILQQKFFLVLCFFFPLISGNWKNHIEKTARPTGKQNQRVHMEISALLWKVKKTQLQSKITTYYV